MSLAVDTVQASRQVSPRPARVLFISHDGQDYLADSLLHGLRTVLGADVLDWPRHDVLYRDYPPEFRERLYGRGFTLYGLLDDLPLNRTWALHAAREGEFELVVFGNIAKQYGLFLEMLPGLQRSKARVAVLDGEDWPGIYPYSPHWWSRPSCWLLPRAHRRYPFFKRELTPLTWAARYFFLVPPGIARRLPLGKVRPISFSIPEEKIAAHVPDKTREFPTHIVDAEVAAHVANAETAYAFTRESDYFADLRSARFGITTKKSGWDTLRHYELAASGTALCFRSLDEKPRECAPHGLHAANAVSYTNWEDLRSRLDRMSDDERVERAEQALSWARANTTRRRAEQFLESMGLS